MLLLLVIGMALGPLARYFINAEILLLFRIFTLQGGDNFIMRVFRAVHC